MANKSQTTAPTDELYHDIDKWHEITLLEEGPEAVPDFWDDCDTAHRLSKFLIQAGWTKVQNG